jgi:hypothetical protein
MIEMTMFDDADKRKFILESYMTSNTTYKHCHIFAFA